MILLADANVLIDLYLVDGLPLAAEIAPTEVLDYIVEEVDSEEQPGIREQIADSSINIVKAEAEWVKHVTETGLSRQDKVNLHYVRQNKRVMLTGEKRLRSICTKEGIEVHGTLWLIDQAHEQQLCSMEDLCRWLRRLSEPDRFMPGNEIENRRKQNQLTSLNENGCPARKFSFQLRTWIRDAARGLLRRRLRVGRLRRRAGDCSFLLAE